MISDHISNSKTPKIKILNMVIYIILYKSIPKLTKSVKMYYVALTARKAITSPNNFHFHY